jgi:tetratricopeptide (TPR) repeat protein
MVKIFHKRPYILIGWSIFIFLLLPFVGIIAPLKTFASDHYLYLPQIGLYFIGVKIIDSLKTKKWIYFLLVIVLVLLFIKTRQQISYWKDDVTLWEYTNNVTKNNYEAHYNLALAYTKKGDVRRGVDEYLKFLTVEDFKKTKARELQRDDFKQKNKKNKEELIACIKNNKSDPSYYYNLGVLLSQEEEFENAKRCFNKSIELDSQYVYALVNLALLYFDEDHKKAIDLLLKASKLTPDLFQINYHLSFYYLYEYRLDKVDFYLKKALKKDQCNYELNLLKTMNDIWLSILCSKGGFKSILEKDL